MKYYNIKVFDRIIYGFLITVFSFSSITNCQSKNTSPVPAESAQMILVITDSIKAVKGSLYYFEKYGNNSIWKWTEKVYPVVLGKNGLGWGLGLHKSDTLKLPVKIERDGRSPAGVFTFGPAFGYAEQQTMSGLNVPYIKITEMLECVDDTASKYYNMLSYKNRVDTVDWKSSEKMNEVGIWYDLGIVINHNSNPVRKKSGSCIFLHNWESPNETSSGCTEMNPSDLKELIYKLDSRKHPVLVQLTKELYEYYKIEWGLPEIKQMLP